MLATVRPRPPVLSVSSPSTAATSWDSGEDGRSFQKSSAAAASEILPGLWLGNMTDAGCEETLSRLRTTHILNVTQMEPNTFESVQRYKYHRVPIRDCGDEELELHLGEAFSFIDDALCSTGSVLVHCKAGVSRSSAIVIAYLMYARGLDLDDAFSFVEQQRPSIAPNFGFLIQLAHLQKRLPCHKGTSSRVPTAVAPCGGDAAPCSNAPSVSEPSFRTHFFN